MTILTYCKNRNSALIDASFTFEGHTYFLSDFSKVIGADYDGIITVDYHNIITIKFNLALKTVAVRKYELNDAL